MSFKQKLLNAVCEKLIKDEGFLYSVVSKVRVDASEVAEHIDIRPERLARKFDAGDIVDRLADNDEIFDSVVDEIELDYTEIAGYISVDSQAIAEKLQEDNIVEDKLAESIDADRIASLVVINEEVIAAEVGKYVNQEIAKMLMEETDENNDR